MYLVFFNQLCADALNKKDNSHKEILRKKILSIIMSGSMNLGILPYLAYNIYKIFNLGEALSNSRRQKIIKEKISTKICDQFTIEGSHMFMKDIKYTWM